MSRLPSALAFALAVALAACGSSKPAPVEQPVAATDTRSLYERLGGTPAITAVVEEFVATTGNDPRISMFFTNADVPRLKQMMVDHICSITGGGCEYTGKSMKESHTDMHVKEEHFAAFMDDLAKTLDKLNVPAREKSEVLAAFEGMKADVVEP